MTKGTALLILATTLLTTLPAPKALGQIVYEGGIKLINKSNEPAHDVNLAFGIPCFFCSGEKITGGTIYIGNQVGGVKGGLFDNDTEFERDILLLNRIVLPGESLDIKVLINSLKTNGIKWRTGSTYLTGEIEPNKFGKKLKTKLVAPNFVVKEGAQPQNLKNNLTTNPTPSLIYSFGNGGNTPLFVDNITLGYTPTFNPDNFSIDLFNQPTAFTNSGKGWLLSPGEDISLDVPFSLPSHSFLLANITGVADPGEPTATPVNFQTAHETVPVPEPSECMGLLVGGLGLWLMKRKAL